MLGKKVTDHVNAKISTIIGADVVLNGNVEAKEAIRIEGTLNGDVKSEGTLVISSTGKVKGNVSGSNIMVAGVIEGDMDSSGRIEVAATGKIMGNIRTKSLIIDENAVFQGQCTMNVGVEKTAAPEQTAPAQKEIKELKAAESKEDTTANS